MNLLWSVLIAGLWVGLTGVPGPEGGFGQRLPGATPVMLGPGSLSTGAHDLVVRFALDLQTCEVMRTGPDWHTALVRMQREGERWKETGLAPTPFPGTVSYPCVSPDGQTLVFDGAQGGAPDLWIATKRGEGWDTPVRLGPEVNSPAVEMHASLAANGNLYFSSNRPGGHGGFDLYRCVRKGDGYGPAENLGPTVNSGDFDAHPWIAQDEGFLLFDSRRPGGQGGNDLYVSFRKADGAWTAARNLGPGINTAAGEMRPYLPPGGRVLIFCSDRSVGDPQVPSPTLEAFKTRIQGPGNGSQDLWWVDFSVVERLRPKDVRPSDWTLRAPVTEALKAGDKAGALNALEHLMVQRSDFDPAADRGFATAFQGDPGFAALVKRHHEAHPVIPGGPVAFTVKDPDLAGEGMAYDPKDRVFYLGSMPGRKILRVTPKGATSDFVVAGQDGLGAVLGLHVDAKRRLLWACSETKAEASVIAFDLATGRPRHRVSLPRQGHLLNDLVVTPGGDVLVTDSEGGKVLRLSGTMTMLEPLDIALSMPNGLALSGDGRLLFVSEFNTGLLRIDLATLGAAPLVRPADLALLGIDGLCVHGRSLLAVHNWWGSMGVVRYHLDATLTKVERVEPLMRRDPCCALPTTGAVAEGAFYYMADTQGRYWKDGCFVGERPPDPIQVLKVPLDGLQKHLPLAREGGLRAPSSEERPVSTPAVHTILSLDSAASCRAFGATRSNLDPSLQPF